MRVVSECAIVKVPGCCQQQQTIKMADTESVDTHDTSNEAGDDPLQDLTDEQLFALVEDTL